MSEDRRARSNAPPLTWLRAFEAAARLGSLKDAADELSVAPSTISHHVRDLEGRLGVPLFTRTGRGVALSEEGAQYFRTLRQAFELLRTSPFHSVESRRLRVGCFPFLANEVLVPRLGELKRALSDVDITIRTETHLEALLDPVRASRLDVLIRYGTGRFPGFLSLKLGDVDLVPIAAPDAQTIEKAEDVLSRPIVRVLGPFDGWQVWAAAHKLDGHPKNIAFETDSYHAAALAVERGVGICLGVLPFMRRWLSAQRVKVLAPLATRVDQGAYLVYAMHNARNREIPLLCEWLRSTLA